jgi:long-chain fatty acid transport protein
MTKLTLLFLAGIGTTAHANGFLLNEFDGRAVGRGNAVAATDTEPSSIYYNIGGLAVAEGTHAIVSLSVVDPFATFTDSTTGAKTESVTGPQPLPALFLSSRISELVTGGIGVTSPFGLVVEWPGSSPLNDVIRREALYTFFITPSVGVNLKRYVPGLSVGAGLDIVPATIELQQNVFFGDVTGIAHVGGSAVGFGGRVGAMYTPDFLSEVSVGAMWRSQVTEDFSGSGNFDAPTPFRSGLPPDGPITTSMKLPQQVTLGAAARPIEHLELEANVYWTQWSKFSTLDINVPSSMGTGTMVISNPQNYANTWSVRAGAEYDWPEYGLGFRAGYIWDPTPIKSQFLTPSLPDIDRNDVTAGVSYKVSKDYTIHAAGLVVLPASRDTAMDPTAPPVHKGTYDVSAFVITASVSATLPTLGL